MALNIVYLDDEAQLCEMFVDNFSSPEIIIQTFVNPVEALKSMNATRPDLVFLDYRLPAVTGDDVARLLHPEIPKALITGDLEVKVIEKFERIFHKPFDFGEMESFIQGHLERKKKL